MPPFSPFNSHDVTNGPHITKRRNMSAGPTPADKDQQQNWASCAPPPPPDHLQSSLLNVGMRVRKAVSSGYKTKNTSFPSYQVPGLISLEMAYPELESTTTTANVAINRICEAVPATSRCEDDDDEGFFSMPPSQENKQKRSHQVVDDDHDDDGVQAPQYEQALPSSSTKPSAFDIMMSNRQHAIPRSQMQKRSKRREYHAAIVRSQHVDVARAPIVPEPIDDFDEASFLQAPETLEMDIDDDLKLAS